MGNQEFLMNFKKNRSSIFIFGLITVLILSFYLFKDDLEGNKSSSKLVESKFTDRRTNDREFSRTKLLKSTRNGSVLIEDYIDDLIKSGMLEKDEEVIIFVQKNITRLRPETLAKLAQESPTLRFWAFKVVAASDDTGYVKIFLSDIRRNSAVLKQFMRTMGDDSPLTDPGKLKETLEKLEITDEHEILYLSNGISSKVSEVKDPKDRLKLIDDYYASSTNSDIVLNLSGEVVPLLPPADAIQWLKSGTPEMMRAGERAFFRDVPSGNYAEAFDYINYLMDDSQTERATAALEDFIPNYAKHDPSGALVWLSSLEPDIRNGQMLLTAFDFLYRAQPDEAIRLAKTTNDPQARVEFERYLRANGGIK